MERCVASRRPRLELASKYLLSEHQFLPVTLPEVYLFAGSSYSNSTEQNGNFLPRFIIKDPATMGVIISKRTKLLRLRYPD